MLRGIEPAFVRAWLWQRAEPGGLAYLDQAAVDALRGFSTGETAIGESTVAEAGAAEWF